MLERMVLFLVCTTGLVAAAPLPAQQPDPKEQLAYYLKAVRKPDGDVTPQMVEARMLAIMELAKFGPDAAPALPDLIDALQIRSEPMRLAAAMTLGKIGKPAVEPVAKLLQSPEPGLRFYAVWTLGWIGPDAAKTQAAVIAMLDDKSADVRRKAVFALGRIGGDPDKAMAAMAGALGDRHRDVRQSATESLTRLGAQAVPVLAGLLKSDQFLVRQAALNTLGKIGPEAKDAVPALQQHLLAKENENPEHCANVLARIGKSALPALQAGFMDKRSEVRTFSALALTQLRMGAAPFLIEALADKNVETRRLAAKTLGSMWIGERSVVLALGAGLSDEDETVRAHCMTGLSATREKAEPVKAKIKAVLFDPNPTVSGFAYFWLRFIGDDQLETIKDALNSKDEARRIRAATMMLMLFPDQHEKAQAIATEALKNKDLALRVEAAFALSQKSTSESYIPYFAEGLKHKSASVRFLSARGLHWYAGGRASTDTALAEAVADPDPEVREAASTGLRAVPREDNNVLIILTKHMEKGDAEVRIEVLKIAHVIGGHRIRAAGLKDRNERVKRQAVASLEMGPDYFVEELGELRKHPDPDLRLQLVPLFHRGGANGLPHLAALLGDSDEMVRASAMSHLQVQGQAAKKALPGIKAATKDENSHVRIMALGWMHLVGGEKPATVLPLFIEALRDDNATVRQTASVLLSNLGADAGPALKLLRELEANDPDPTVRNVAGNSARLIDGLIKK